MQFTTVVATLFAASAMAMPAPITDSSAVHMASLQAQAGGCDIFGCVVALGPVSVTCAAAIAQEGIDVVNDLACIAAALADIESAPSACKHC